jgi:mono/diheme cytochrome c family protein
LPGDSAEGKRLHDANCMGCHDAGIYTRNNRLVQSLDALIEQLGNCSHMANKEFSAAETQNILKYLNDQFYKF